MPVVAGSHISAMERGSPQSIRLSHDQQERVQALARSMSGVESVERLPSTNLTKVNTTATVDTAATLAPEAGYDPEKITNPFVSTDGDDALDPHSEKFNPEKWLKMTMKVASRDSVYFPVRLGLRGTKCWC